MTQSPPSHPPAFPSRPAGAGGLAITALVLGILALLLSLVIFGGLLGVVSLILGIVAWASAAKNPARTKGVAIAATIISALAVLVSVVLLVLAVIYAVPIGQKVVALEPLQRSGGQAVTAAIQSGADSAAVTTAAEDFDAEIQRIALEAADPEAAKQQGAAALQNLQDQLDALPTTGGGDVGDDAAQP